MKRKRGNIVLEKVLVEDHAGEGRSLARVDGKVVFIEATVPGDIVDVRIVRSKKDWAEGYPLLFHEYSKDRVMAFCEHFGICGGCQWQMLPYEKQLFYKQKQMEENLKRIGKVPLPAALPIIGANHERYYRNKLEYTFANKKFLLHDQLHDPSVSTFENVAGFHAQGIFDKVVDINTCHLQAEPTNKLRLAVKQYGMENGLDFYDIRRHSGFLRTMQVRLCRSGELMLNIVFGREDEEERVKLLDFMKQSFPEITTLLYTINNKKNDSLVDLTPQAYSGKGYVIETLEDFQFKIGPKSFFQTNTEQAERLYQVSREFAELTGKEIVFDLYCGTGSIGIFVSRFASLIVGVDLVEEAIADARENAALNELQHTRFFAGDVINICDYDFFAQQGKPDVIITDPPRAGMHEKLLQKILSIEAPIVVYVSCNPATQGRDLNGLSEKYEVTKIQPVDMFPHTHHIENVAQLKLKK